MWSCSLCQIFQCGLNFRILIKNCKTSVVKRSKLHTYFGKSDFFLNVASKNGMSVKMLQFRLRVSYSQKSASF